MNFDDVIDRKGSHCAKWDLMEENYGVPAEQGIAMWVADMDFRPPQVIREALQAVLDHGFFGYFGDESAYLSAIEWWMKTRHNWQIEPEWIFSTHGLVNGTAMCIDAFSQPGDGIMIMTPVYHAFARIIRASNRDLIECELQNTNGRYELNIEAWESQLKGHERILLLCSPHNPGGRVWTKQELQAIAAFSKRHDLILVSDEIHHDLVFPEKTHVPMATADPSICDRLVMMTAGTKTFNIAGTHCGNVIIPDPKLRHRFALRMSALGLSPNSFGLFATTAAYSAAGAQWVDALMRYLDESRMIFDDRVNAVTGLRSMPLEATYLSWVDFSQTGLPIADVIARIETTAKIAVNHGSTFGKGGEMFMRFNIATPRSIMCEALDRLEIAFQDLC
ncbi:MAG: pyridoxal phosphate-dependent aminotransferase [Aestuariivita sp.]|nr:pyridoxal phosphate-dependent aminotransferase [Aestuariivita sp.]MCY4202545.1 pyridoxal phosphate-dependent aminotransferase [Aestuariivita sp.]MCY4287432.1 pyridoxal phosphate-dependent aminotransferase [Aestuariivita sp.]MCY4347266.1 pyridoxal phosphate-dependent aminotransferase [Aestuariivita sp.]